MRVVVAVGAAVVVLFVGVAIFQRLAQHRVIRAYYWRDLPHVLIAVGKLGMTLIRRVT